MLKIQMNIQGIYPSLVSFYMPFCGISDYDGMLAMKTLLAEIPPTSSILKSFCDSIVPKIIASISGSASNDESRVINGLDIVHEIVIRNSQMLLPFSSEIRRLMINLIDHPRSLIRKKVINTYSVLLLDLPAEAFNEFISHITKKMEGFNTLSGELLKSNLYAWSTICRTDPLQFAPYVNTSATLILQIIELEEKKDRDDVDDEVLEMGFLALESIQTKCQGESEPLLPNLFTFAMQFIKYDPNYQDIDDASDEDQMDISDDEFADDFGDDEE